MKQIIFVIIVVFSINTGSAAEISYKEVWNGTIYFVNGERIVWEPTVIKELEKNPDAKAKLEGVYTDFALFLLIIPGAGLVGGEIGGNLGGKESDSGKLIGGLALIGAGYYFGRQSRIKIKNAIDVYNSSSTSSKTQESDFAYYFLPQYFGLRYKF